MTWRRRFPALEIKAARHEKLPNHWLLRKDIGKGTISSCRSLFIHAEIPSTDLGTETVMPEYFRNGSDRALNCYIFSTEKLKGIT